MMRTPYRPLALLVDAAAEKWLAAQHAPERERLAVQDEIVRAFRIGDRAELTFHGLRYLLSIVRRDDGQPREFLIAVHQIAGRG
jgi:hypothetical protein